MSEIDSNKITEIELEQTFETFRSLLRLVVTTLSIFISANVLLIGYALVNQAALVIGVGAIFPLAIMGMLRFTGRMFVSVFYTGVSLEKEVGHRPDLFFWSLVTVMAGYKAVSRFKSIASLDTYQERMEHLARDFGRFIPMGCITMNGMLLLAVLQVLAVPFVYFAYGWTLL